MSEGPADYRPHRLVRALTLALMGSVLAVSACAPNIDPTAIGPSTDGESVALDTESSRRGAAGAPGWPRDPDDVMPPVAPVRFGIAVEGASPARLAALESMADAEVGVVRVFARWDTDFPTANHQALLDAGRRIHLSVRPRTDAGVVIPWAEVATAEPGSDVYRRLTEWTTTVARYGPQIYFTFNHEPETADSAANGDAEDFVAAWRRVVELLRANGGDDVPTVVVLGRGAYADGSIDRWYPGDDVVDIVGVDPYNWFGCQGTDRPWTSAQALLAPALAFAAERDKPLAVPEIASTEDPADPDRKARWIDELADTLAEGPDAGRFSFVAWFSVHDRSWPDCAWEYNSSAASAEALAQAVARLALNAD